MVQRGVLHLRNLVRLVALGAQTDNFHLLGRYPLGEGMQEQSATASATVRYRNVSQL